MPGILAEIKSLFGDNRSFYDILNITKEATKDEVRKAYYKLSLKVHPDRAPADELEQSTRKFQALGKIYEVLSDDERRAVYDEDGTVDDESCVGSEGRDWYAYWRLLFGQVQEDDIVSFETQYKGSDEELEDLKIAYTSCRGDMDKIIDSVLCATVDDEPRFRQILEKLIADGTIEAYSAFTNERKSKAVARKRKAEAESKEAEQLKKKASKGDSTNLAALILRNQQSREKQMDAFFDDLAAKYGSQNTASKASSKTKTAAKKSATKTSTKRTVSKSQIKSKAKK